MQIDIAFLSRHRYPGHLDLIVFMTALTVFAGAGWFAYDKYLAIQNLQNTLSVSRTPSSEKRIQPISTKQVGEINMAIMQLNLPWADFLAAIERNLSSNVALLGIEPNAERQTVRIEGEAKTAEDMIDFVEQLGQDSFFQAASLLRHQINDSDRNRPYRFTMEAAWR